jgi:hypothetical protein
MISKTSGKLRKNNSLYSGLPSMVALHPCIVEAPTLRNRKNELKKNSGKTPEKKTPKKNSEKKNTETKTPL